MKIAIINDTHLGIRNSADIFLENQNQFYSEIFFPYLEKHGIEQIIHLGDYYDNRKALNIKALHSNRKYFLNVLRDRGIKMDVILGNHDTYFKNTNEVNSPKEVLGHFMNEVNLIVEPRVLEYGGTRFAMLPWITNQNYDDSLKFVKNCKADILCGHLELEGFELMRGVTNKHGMDHELFSRFEKVLTGHFHTSSQKDNIYYLGSQFEFTWADAGDPKYFHIFDTENRELYRVQNPFTMFEKIVYDDTQTDYNKMELDFLDNKFVKVVVVEKKDTFVFDRFIDRIQQQNIHDLKIAENFSEFLGENVDDEEISVEDTTELLDSYIEAVDTDLDKDRIRKSMRRLLVQAQSMEIV